MNHPAMSIRIQAACSELIWAVRLNLIWIVFTLAGGVILGLGPATVAAYTLARRHARSETFHAWSEFWTVYRREFVRASLLVLPMALAATVLIGNYLYFSALGPSAGALRIATLVALIALAGVGAYVGPLYVHYDLPLWAYVPKACQLALMRPASSVLLLLVLSAIAYATSAAPVLAALISIGAWIYLNTWLCLRFFEENEARLHSKGNS
ncbi:YesL family protein [Nonomuraea sp. NPDC049480]|uniref:YesL family protein n=1 Tax=Nonomuraea sp. NPDC049480 TaxID=3364353 RepID=UPI0037B6A8ED